MRNQHCNEVIQAPGRLPLCVSLAAPPGRISLDLVALVHQFGRPAGQIGSAAANRDLTADPLDGYLRMRMHEEFQILRGWHHRLRHHLRYGLTSPPDAVLLTWLALPCEVRFRITRPPSLRPPLAVWPLWRLPVPTCFSRPCVCAFPFCTTLWLSVIRDVCLNTMGGWAL